MIIERRSLRLLTALLFFLVLTPFLWAQNSTETRHVRLAWTPDEYTLRYEVIIEKEDAGEYRRVLREFTNTFFIDVTLQLGKYRCCVIPYDFLEQPGEGSLWISFDVRTAYIPKPPESAAETRQGEIVIDYPETEAEPVEPVEPEPELEPEPVEPMEYDEPPPQVEERKLASIYLSAAWMPMVPVYYEEQSLFLGESPSLSGAAARLGMLYCGSEFLNPGLELTGTWYTFNAASNRDETSYETSYETSLQHAATIGLNLVAQKRPPGSRIALMFRLGAGLTLLPLKHSFFTNIGASFLVYVSEHFYLETGLDHTHLFTTETSGSFRPWLGFGLQL